MKASWKYWALITDPSGRQRWTFTAPDDMDWETEEGIRFLENLGRDFDFDATLNPNSADRVYRAQQTRHFTPATAVSGDRVWQATHRAIHYYQSLQAPSGHWPGDYAGPLFLIPGLLIASYVTESPLPKPHQTLLKRYLLNHQRADGGWGLHIEGPSTMFGTAMHYAALRILGSKPGDEPLAKARAWIHRHGGATRIPSWGKFYLSVLGAYDWRGCHSLFPEMWLLPRWLPFHPSRYWCHARMVYLPMSYCYGLKVTGPITPLVEELRTELYPEDYSAIDWIEARDACAETDLYCSPKPLLKILNRVLNGYERHFIPSWRKRALEFVREYIDAEDDHTHFINIGPVNQAINSIAVWHAHGRDSARFQHHMERWFDFLWLAEDGLKMNGENGSQLWDTALAVQAIVESPCAASFAETIKKAYRFIDTSQIRQPLRDGKRFFRHDSVGGWPFTTVEQAWPVADCTAEGLKAALLVQRFAPDGWVVPIPPERLRKALDLILSFQNQDGGWATYELTRGPRWLEQINPSEIFGDIMIDYSYTECTSACVQSLLTFRKDYPEYRKAAVDTAIKRGLSFILSQQRPDGSWYGSWAVCFTYGTWFAVEALHAALDSGLCNPADARIQAAIQAACRFLLAKQNGDGGWGERFDSCTRKEYVPHPQSQIVNTSWALLALMLGGAAHREAVDKGIELILARQLDNGDFPQEGISGVFNHSCMITYTAYRNVFPIWALGRYLRTYAGASGAAEGQPGTVRQPQIEVSR